MFHRFSSVASASSHRELTLLAMHSAVLFLALFLPVALSSQAPDWAEKARRANELVLAGKAEEATAIYRELVEAFPSDPGIRMNLCIAEFKAKGYRAAIEQAQAALKLQPELVTANLFLGASYAQLRDYARAVGPLEKVIQAQPDERNAHVMLAEALLELQRYEEASGHFHKASELAADNPRVWYGLGRSLEALSDRAFAQLGKAAPDSAYWFALAAQSDLQQRRFGKALAHSNQALARSPGLRGVHSGLAAMYRQTGHPDRGASEEQSERDLPPVDCASQPLECSYAAGRYSEVVQAVSSAGMPESLYWLSKAYQQLARQAYQRLEALPPSLQAHLHAARTLDARGMYREAAQEWRQALNLSPDDPDIRIALAWSLYRSQDHEETLVFLANSLKDSPASTEANFLYGASLLGLEQPEKAIPYLQAALKTDPQFLPAQAALGQALLRLGKAQQAIPYLKAALAIDDDGSRHFQLLRAYQITGQAELAKQVLSQYEAFRKSAEAKRRLEEGDEILSEPPRPR